jgi:hypothetical protein
MDVDEVRRSFDDLSETLRKLGLTWIVHQVEETIREGHIVEKETRIFQGEEPLQQNENLFDQPPMPRRPGKPSHMLTLQPWSPTEQLLFLIDGVRHAIVHAAEVENKQLELLRELGKVSTVQFEPDAEDPERRSLRLTGQTDQRIAALGRFLDGLEREARG